MRCANKKTLDSICWLVVLDPQIMTTDGIKSRLVQTYADAKVEVIDLTGTRDHYQVTIKTNALNGLSRVQQHKAIMSVFDKELKSGEIHAFTIKISTLE